MKNNDLDKELLGSAFVEGWLAAEAHYNSNAGENFMNDPEEENRKAKKWAYVDFMKTWVPVVLPSSSAGD
jgi:hypothetical protein